MRHLFLCVLAALMSQAAAIAAASPQSLLVLISVDQTTVAFPPAVPVKLHFHNAGVKTLWLYRPLTSGISGSPEFDSTGQGAPQKDEGPKLSASLIPISSPDPAKIQSAADAIVLVSAGLPHPHLTRLAPGEDADETAFLEFKPAVGETPGGAEPIWGQYKFSVAYTAKFSNSGELARAVGAEPWEGEAKSNEITLDFEPPSGQGSVSGAVQDAGFGPIQQAIISLSDEKLRLIAQERSDEQGHFTFTDLPWGLYWVTARRRNATVETAAVRHLVLSARNPSGSVEIALFPFDIYDAKQILHKPVFLRVTDGQNRPLSAVTLKLLSAQEPVIENVQTVTGEDGLAAVELIPGSVYVTFERRGCKKADQRIEISPGAGVDGASLEYDCSGN